MAERVIIKSAENIDEERKREAMNALQLAREQEKHFSGNESENVKAYVDRTIQKNKDIFDEIKSKIYGDNKDKTQEQEISEQNKNDEREIG